MSALPFIAGIVITVLATLFGVCVLLITRDTDDTDKPYSARRAMQHQESNHEH